MRVARHQIHEVTESVCTATLGMPVTPSEGEHVRAAVTACVQITGAFTGAVTLGCTTVFAQRAAGVMFDRPAEAVSNEEVQDAIGELANMVGGNVKGLLPGTCQLSLPAVASGELALPRASLVEEMWFDCGGESIVVRVLSQEPAAH